jgi:hypothetical protein
MLRQLRSPAHVDGTILEAWLADWHRHLTHAHYRTPPALLCCPRCSPLQQHQQQLLLAAGWQCLISVRDYCSIADSSGCLRNWPMIPVEPGVLKYYNLELGWYLHLMLKHPLGEFGFCWSFNVCWQEQQPAAAAVVLAGKQRALREGAACVRRCSPGHAGAPPRGGVCLHRPVGATAAAMSPVGATAAVLCCAVHVADPRVRSVLCAAGLGLQDNGTMGAHHLATVALVVMSYMLNVHLLGEDSCWPAGAGCAWLKGRTSRLQQSSAPAHAACRLWLTFLCRRLY